MSEKKVVLKVDKGAQGTENLEVAFPPNSHKSKDVESKKVQKVIKGKAVKQKKTLGRKFAETFFGDDIESVSSYVLYDVLIPATKNTLSDMVSNGIEMLLFGQTKGSRTRRDKGRSYVSYSNYYRQDDRPGAARRREPSQRNRSRHNFDDILLESRGDAEDVLSLMINLTEDYGAATVADLYDLVGITSQFTDNKYGWDNLAASRVVPVRGGYIIELPRPIVLD